MENRKDRRYYSRLNINIPCIIYYKNKEYSGIARDISEEGIGILINDKIKDNFKIDETLIFSFIDKFKKLNAIPKEYIITGNAKIKRISSTNENKIILGCIYNQDHKIEEYVSDKKVTNYIKNNP